MRLRLRARKKLCLHDPPVAANASRGERVPNKDVGALIRNPMDALSVALNSVKLDGAIYLDAEFTAPWCIRGKYGRESIRERLAGAEHVAFFYLVTEGAFKVSLEGSAEVIDAIPGDLVVLQDQRHRLGSSLDIAPFETDRLIAGSAAADGDILQLRHSGNGTITRFVCGYLACNPTMCKRLLRSLPRLVRISTSDCHESMLLRSLVRKGVHESRESRMGTDPTLSKLGELMFVGALRRYVEHLPQGGRGWLASLQDALIGRVLALMHEEPHRSWSVADLASEVAVSRSLLGQRFTHVVGESPMRYLFRWRLALASETLRSSTRAIARIAERSGYTSEAAFSRAFKREFGVPPSVWRRTPGAQQNIATVNGRLATYGKQ